MNIYFVVDKKINKNNQIEWFLTTKEKYLVDFMRGRDFKNYNFWKNFRNIDFSKCEYDNYVDLNNFAVFLKNY